MKIYQETNDFYEIKELLWSGAENTLQQIDDAGKFDAFDDYINDLYPDGVDLTSLNDMLRFDSDQILKDLGIVDEETITEIENLISEINEKTKSLDEEKIINQIRFDVEDDEVDDIIGDMKEQLNNLKDYVKDLNIAMDDTSQNLIDIEDAAYNIYTDLKDYEDYASDIESICDSARELEKLAQDAQ